VVLLTLGVSLRLLAQGQTPTFRAGVDLIAVDVQVIDKDGTPIRALVPGDFDVAIGGQRRRVVSADFIESTAVDGRSLDRTAPIAPGPHATNQWPDGSGAARTYMLVFDTDSFTVGESRDVVAAARGFISRLQPIDRVGLYTFPVGPRVEPTTDHAAVSASVDTIVGHTQHMPGSFNLTASEIIDITAELTQSRLASLGRQQGPGPVPGAPALAGNEGEVTRRVQQRECGDDARCVDEIQAEAQSLAFYLEGRATEGLNGLRELVRLLSLEPGRKTMVMFSAGIPTSDRPGGRPDVGDLAKALGQDAAATNTTIYVLHFDMGAWRQMAAETRKANSAPVSASRDHVVTGRLLSEFSGSSGGALIRVVMGGGDFALTRVLRETSSHYLLGVEPADRDRDGKLRDLRVKVSRKGATIRSRIWVVVPPKRET
jgi:VWFA-related protein